MYDDILTREVSTSRTPNEFNHSSSLMFLCPSQFNHIEDVDSIISKILIYSMKIMCCYRYFLFTMFILQLPKVFGQVRVAVKGTGRTLIQVFLGIKVNLCIFKL